MTRTINPRNPASWPVSYESSKGERIKDPPTPDSRLAEADRMLDGLPQAPERYASNDEIAVFLVRVSELEDGADRLKWIRTPDVWPHFFNTAPITQQNHINDLLRGIDEKIRAAREREHAERVAAQKVAFANKFRTWREGNG